MEFQIIRGCRTDNNYYGHNKFLSKIPPYIQLQFFGFKWFLSQGLDLGVCGRILTHYDLKIVALWTQGRRYDNFLSYSSVILTVARSL